MNNGLGKPCVCLICKQVMYRKRFYDHCRSKHKDFYEERKAKEGGGFMPQEDRDFSYKDVDLSKLNEGDNASSYSGAVRNRSFSKKKRDASSDSEITPPKKALPNKMQKRRQSSSKSDESSSDGEDDRRHRSTGGIDRSRSRSLRSRAPVNKLKEKAKKEASSSSSEAEAATPKKKPPPRRISSSSSEEEASPAAKPESH